MGAEGELVSVENELKSLKDRIEDRLQSVRNELDRDNNCHIKTCHKKKYDNGKCEGHYLRDKHASMLYDKYDKPIASLAVQLMEFNVKKWIPDKDGTIGADDIREHGLTRLQRRWLNEFQARSETNIDGLIEDVEQANEDAEVCPVCGYFPKKCSCARALNHLIVEGINSGTEEEQ